MGKQSDAKRQKKLQERRKKAEAAAARASDRIATAAAWFEDDDGGPIVLAEVIAADGDVLARLEGEDENWMFLVGEEPRAGSSDEFVTLSFLLGYSADLRAAGTECYLSFSQWLLDEIERRCEAADVEWMDFLTSLLPADKRALALPDHRMQ